MKKRLFIVALIVSAIVGLEVHAKNNVEPVVETVEDEEIILNNINALREKEGLKLLSLRFEENGTGMIGEINDDTIEALSMYTSDFVSDTENGVYYKVGGQTQTSGGNTYVFTTKDYTGDEFWNIVSNIPEFKELLVADYYEHVEVTYVPSIGDGYYDSWQLILYPVE